MPTTVTAPLDIAALLPDGKHLITGEWVPARSKATIDVIDPATGALLARVPRGTAEDIDDAVRSAEAALPAWRDTSPAVRGELLYRWAELVREHDDDINRLEAMEVGHPVGPSPIAARLTYLAGKADKVFGDTLPTRSPDVLGLTLREPYGVVGAIIPWNAPGPMTVFNTAAPIAMRQHRRPQARRGRPAHRSVSGAAGPGGGPAARRPQRRHRIRLRGRLPPCPPTPASAR